MHADHLFYLSRIYFLYQSFLEEFISCHWLWVIIFRCTYIFLHCPLIVLILKIVNKLRNFQYCAKKSQCLVAYNCFNAWTNFRFDLRTGFFYKNKLSSCAQKRHFENNLSFSLVNISYSKHRLQKQIWVLSE